MSERKIIAYELTPVYEAGPNELVSAACIHCVVTSEYLSGYGGGGVFVSPAVYNIIADGRLRSAIFGGEE